MTRSLPSSFARSASSIAPRMAWEASGAGMMSSVRANCTAASKQASCRTARASTMPASTSCDTSGEAPW
jgi:hypothetical protein